MRTNLALFIIIIIFCISSNLILLIKSDKNSIKALDVIDSLRNLKNIISLLKTPKIKFNFVFKRKLVSSKKIRFNYKEKLLIIPLIKKKTSLYNYLFSFNFYFI